MIKEWDRLIFDTDWEFPGMMLRVNAILGSNGRIIDHVTVFGLK